MNFLYPNRNTAGRKIKQKVVTLPKTNAKAIISVESFKIVNPKFEMNNPKRKKMTEM